MKDKIIDYIEACGISVEHLSEILHMDRKKFEKNSGVNWKAEELLEIGAYLDIDPMAFYDRQL